MKFLAVRKDGGQESTVTGYWLVEIKSLFSICLLRFDGKSRRAFHTHAFNCLSWVLKGRLKETFFDGRRADHPASFRPFVTRRSDFHKVDSAEGASWVLTFRGPWKKHWLEYRPADEEFVTLAEGRQVINRTPYPRLAYQ